jgi:hypothetical protein
MTVRTDSFSRPNGSLGANWTPWSWSGSAALSITSDAAAATNSISSGAYWSADSFGATQFSFSCVTVLPSSGQWAGVTVRQSGIGDNGYLAIWFGGTFYIFIENGSPSPPILTSGSGSLNAGDTMCLAASGTTITLYHNGVQVLRGTDSTWSSGSPGLAAYGASSATTPWIGGDGAVPPFAAWTGTTAGDGCQTWLCTSPLNGPSPTVLRIVPPSSPAAGYPHSFLIAVPVSTGLDATYGDPVTVIQDDLAAPNQYNATLIVPSFAQQPWLADTPGNSAASQESFMAALQSWLVASQFAGGSEKCHLIGFSKSGLGCSSLLFKRAPLFDSGAFWDFPAMMNDYTGDDAYDSSPVGGAPAFSYGTDSNFQSNYRLSSANITSWNAAAGGSFSSRKRIWTGGYAAFPQNVAAYQSLLTSLGILYAGTWSVGESHAWHDDWVASALAAIIPRSSGSGLLMASGIA